MKPKLNQKMLETIVELKSHGLSDKDIYAAVGISHTTYYRWINKPSTKLQRALSEELKKAESAYKRQLLDTIKEAAVSRPQYWTAAAWILERKYPEEFGQNRASTNDTEAPQIVLGVTVKPAEE